MGGEGRESKVCGPFLVVLSVTLWHNAAHDTRSSRAGGAAGSARARGVEHAQVEGQALRLVLGSNRSFLLSLLLLVLLFALLLYSLVVCSPAECSTPQSRSSGFTHAHEMQTGTIARALGASVGEWSSTRAQRKG